MKTVSQRSTLATVTKPDELELQPSQPRGAGESGGRVVRGKVSVEGTLRTHRRRGV